jgi:hypothetical protein
VAEVLNGCRTVQHKARAGRASTRVGQAPYGRGVAAQRSRWSRSEKEARVGARHLSA